MKRITIPEIRLHPWFQHKLPPYLRHPPELMEKQERIVDQGVIDEVMKLPFHKAWGNPSQTSSGGINGVMNMPQHQQIPNGIVSRELIEHAAALEDNRDSDAPKTVRDLRVAYELILDHKHTRLRVMEVARAIKEAASATPPAFSPGGSRSATPGGHYGSGRYSSGNSYDGRAAYSNNISYSSHSQSPTAQSSPGQQARLAEEATRALMQPAGSQNQYSGSSPASSSTPLTTAGGHPVVQMTSSIPGNTGMIAQHQHGRRTRRWYLGIQSKKDPAHVMTEVYKALMALGCEWLQLSSYRIKCKWRPNAPTKPVGAGLLGSNFMVPTAGGDTPQAAWSNKTPSTPRRADSSSMDVDVDNKDKSPAVQPSDIGMVVLAPKNDDDELMLVPDLSTDQYSVKIGLTLYKVQQNIYLLDFQKMTGDAFSFMTLCANIITELKTLSAASKAQQQAMLAQQQAAAQQQAMQQAGRFQAGAPK
jgi:hypothetical protein